MWSFFNGSEGTWSKAIISPFKGSTGSPDQKLSSYWSLVDWVVGFSVRWVSEVAGWMDEDMGMKDREMGLVR